MIELKLRIAYEAGMPFYVFGTDQFKGLADGIQLSIVDAVIGDLFAAQAIARRFKEGFDPEQHGYTEESFAELDPDTQSDIVEDWAIGVEVENDHKHNPIVQRVYKLRKVVRSSGYSIFYPRVEGYDRNKWSIVEVGVSSSRYGEEFARVCVPNFESNVYCSSLHFAQDIAHMLALESLRCRAGLPMKSKGQ